MSVGGFARKLLGDRFFPIAGHYYRAIFVDLEKVARAAVDEIPQGALVLDIGGGDGAPLNCLLRLRPDISVTMIDLNPWIGGAVAPELRSRVVMWPGTSVRDYIVGGGPKPDCIMISDVIHPIPVHHRDQFFKDVRELVGDGRPPVIIKDVEPGDPRSYLSLWADRYISGDKTVSLISRAELGRAMAKAFGHVDARETALFREDRPNYSMVFRLLPNACSSSQGNRSTPSPSASAKPQPRGRTE